MQHPKRDQTPGLPVHASAAESFGSKQKEERDGGKKPIKRRVHIDVQEKEI